MNIHNLDISNIAENYIRNAIVTKVTDGDTIVCLVDMGYHITTLQPLRFNRINAPEMNTVEGKNAKAFLLTQIQVGSNVLVKTYKNPNDKYARWLADIFYNGICLNDLMVEQGHAIYKDY